ncbi:sulfurtransferase complex subunit TusD [Buchnera aphidicola (Ceratovacuna keduensis)]|uniref:sulfurtransferase complex subunit TusD n=1 Tax=Buchnera aphidicola TaxID=9 RepID=UPI0031B83EDD
MKYTILVTGPCYGTQNSISSFLFSKNLIIKKHKIKSIFFYSDGVYNSNIMNFSNHNKINLLKCWKKLSNKFNINLKICIGSSLRRGIFNKDFAIQKGINFENMDLSFKISSFSELAKDILSSERIVQF